MDTLLTQSDFITLHVPLTPETRGMISTQEFNLMKPTAYLLNSARGNIVYENALALALKKKQIKCLTNRILRLLF